MSLADSVISLRSISDSGFDFETPRESNARSKVKKNIKNASPYGTPTKSIKQGKKSLQTGRELWLSSLQNGRGISNEGSAMNAWKANGRNKSGRSTASNYLIEQLTGVQKMQRPSSATFHRAGGKGPVYKDAETYYDEIQALKRTLRHLQQDNNLMKAKMLRLEEENAAKSKKIEELLSPQTQSNDLRRTLTSKNADTSEVVLSLKRKIYKLEENLRGKENEVRKMKSEMKFTDLEELRIENQILMYEISSLNENMNDLLNAPKETTVSQDVIDSALMENDNKKTQVLLKKLTADNQSLVLENKSLKNDVKKLQNNSDFNPNKEHEDMSRAELLKKLSSLEQRLKQEEKRPLIEEKVDKKNEDNNVLDDRCIEVKGPLPQQIKQLRSREKELLSDIDQLEITVNKLKEDRIHYRKLTDDYKKQLDDLKKEIRSSSSPENKNTTPKIEKSEVVKSQQPNGIKSRENSFDQSTRQNIRKKSSIVQSRKYSSVDPRQQNRVKEFQEKHAAKTIQRQWRNKQKNENSLYKSAKKDEEEFDEAVIDIQSAWRGHQSRKKFLQAERNATKDDVKMTSSIDDDDITLIQASLRGHRARKEYLKKLNTSRERHSKDFRIRTKTDDESSYDDDDDVISPRDYKPKSSVKPRSSQTVKPIMKNQPISDEESDDDDDVIVGSSASLSKYRNSGKIDQSKPRQRKPTNENDFHRNEDRRLSGKYSYASKLPFNDNISDDEELYSRFRKQSSGRNNPKMSVSELKQASSPWSNLPIESNEESELDEKPNKKRKEKLNGRDKRKSQAVDDERHNVASRWGGSNTPKSNNGVKSSSRHEKKRYDVDSSDEIPTSSSFQRTLSSRMKKRSSALDDELF